MKFKTKPDPSKSSVFKLHSGKISKSKGRKKEKKFNGAVENNSQETEDSRESPSNLSTIQCKRKEKNKNVQNVIDNSHNLISVEPLKRKKKKKNFKKSGAIKSADISESNGCSEVKREANVLLDERSSSKEIKRNPSEDNSNPPLVKKKKKKKQRKNSVSHIAEENGKSEIKSVVLPGADSSASASIDCGIQKKRKKKRSKKKHSDGESEVTQAVISKTFEKKTKQSDPESTGKEIVPKGKKIQKLKGKVEAGSSNLTVKAGGGVDDDQTRKHKREKFKNSKNSSLREKMLSRLSAARFRYINEELYTWDGQNSPAVFASDPKSFKAYHSGFKQQTKLWPINPIDVIIKSIKKLPGFDKKVIADFGCGEAKLALELSSNKVYSFDLIALNDRVTVSDNANTKLYSGSVDIAVHCLSLMSSNISGYIKEANRVLKIGGLLKIAEVESRFEDVEKFVENVCKFNFKLLKNDLSHNLFYFMDFEKVADIGVARKRKLPELSLQPCLYKKRGEGDHASKIHLKFLDDVLVNSKHGNIFYITIEYYFYS